MSVNNMENCLGGNRTFLRLRSLRFAIHAPQVAYQVLRLKAVIDGLNDILWT